MVSYFKKHICIPVANLLLQILFIELFIEDNFAFKISKYLINALLKNIFGYIIEKSCNALIRYQMQRKKHIFMVL